MRTRDPSGARFIHISPSAASETIIRQATIETGRSMEDDKSVLDSVGTLV